VKHVPKHFECPIAFLGFDQGFTQNDPFIFRLLVGFYPYQSWEKKTLYLEWRGETLSGEIPYHTVHIYVLYGRELPLADATVSLSTAFALRDLRAETRNH
jgi:hypothetical protein